MITHIPNIKTISRQKTAAILDDEGKHPLSHWVNAVIILTIILTVVSIVLESVPELEAKFSPIFYTIEYFFIGVWSGVYLSFMECSGY